MAIEQFLAQNSQTMGAASQAANIALQLGNMGLQYHMFKDAQRFNSAESAKQRRFAVEQWQRETAYNTPSAQIERLKAAGINPALAYVDGSLANTAGSSPALSEAQSPSAPHMTAPQVDPLVASQIAKTNAETQAIEDSNNRENEKQPVVLQQLEETLNETRQSIKNMSMQEQVYSMDYLTKALTYQFQNRTFNTNVRKVTEELRATKLGADFTEYQVRRGLQLLPFEVMGFKVSNAKGWQELKQMKDLLPKIIREYNDKHAIDHNTTVLQSKDATLKDLEFWCNYADNYRGASLYDKTKFGSTLDTEMNDWMSGLLQSGYHLMRVITPFKFGK